MLKVALIRSFLVRFMIWTLVSEVECIARHRLGRSRSVRHIQEGAIRLVGGFTEYEGNVEIFHVGIWGSICDDEWDVREALVACKTLGFTNASKATHNSQFGKGRRIIWMDNLYCDGHETRLQDCKYDGWGVHDCTATESAGVVCENVNPISTAVNREISTVKAVKLQALWNMDLFLRLMGGRNSNEGRVEVRINDGKWGLICGDGWSLLEATVVCKQLDLGYGQAAIQSSYFGGAKRDVIVNNVKCNGVEDNISNCTLNYILDHVSCKGNEDSIAGVICSKELPDLIPDEVEVERSVYLEDRQLLFLQCAMEENCLASTAYALNRNDYGWQYEQRRLLRFTARIGNIGTSDFIPFLPKHAWQYHMCHLHYHSMEVFAHFDITDMRGQKVAEGHKASFCLEDSNCLAGVEKKFSCADYGDQGISVGCTDTYLHNIDCQWVDMTDLQPGIYQFKVSINPEFKVAELNYENNAASCVLYYNAVTARLFNCTLTRP